MGHGTTGPQDLGLAAYAERFTAAGVAALAFDYRHFGTSGGEPRQLIHIPHQLDDYRAAIRFARGLDGLDPKRIALWGSSLSGGHVIAVAATDPHIAAVVSQVPWFGVERGRSSPRSTQVTLRLFAVAIRDVVGSLLGCKPCFIKTIGDPGEVAAFTGADARVMRDTLAPQAPTWRNEFAARSLFSLLRYHPGTEAKHLAMPLLVCISDQDTAASAPLATQMARQALRAEVHHYPFRHFDVYFGEGFEKMVADQVRFLRTHLLAAEGTAG
jgi:acetyl esterase/lipase